MLGQDAQGG